VAEGPLTVLTEGKLHMPDALTGPTQRGLRPGQPRFRRAVAAAAALTTAVGMAGLAALAGSPAAAGASVRPGHHTAQDTAQATAKTAPTGPAALGNPAKTSVLVKDHLLSKGPSEARLRQLSHVRDQPLALRPAVAHGGTAETAPSQKQWMVQIDYDGPGGQPWTLSDFQYLASLHLTGVEINLSWNQIEPSQGTFALGTLQNYLSYAAQAHLQLVPIFWEAIWGGNDPSWLNAPPEETNTGSLDQQPAMWSSTAYDAYSNYLLTTLKAIQGLPGYGGSYIDYGWLDAMWGPPPSGGGMPGYAAVDVDAFHQWLPTQYRNIKALNAALGTSYATFDDVPAFQPGDAHFDVYQKFRMSSYQTIMTHLLSQVRQVTQKPLYLYFGGDMDDVGVEGNIPDQIFSMAREFHAYVSLDDADNTALADLFGYLSQGYGVPLLNEWTPIPGNSAEVALWQGHYTLEGANRLGEDYFIYSGGTASGTFSQYLSLHDQVDQVTGHLPAYRVGILVGYDQVIQGLQQERVPGGDAALAEYIDTNRPAAQIVTDAAVLNGAVHLSDFKVLVDWNSDLSTPGLPAQLTRALRQFKAQGGKIISAPLDSDGNPVPSQAIPSAFTASPQSDQLETWIALHGRRAWVTLANGEEDLPILDTLTGGGRTTLGNLDPYSGTVTINPASGITATPVTLNEQLPSATVVEQSLTK